MYMPGTGAALHARKAALAEQLYASAHAALEEGEDDRARQLFCLMLVCEPRDERGWVGLGVCHERAGDDHLARTAAIYTIGLRLVGESAWLGLGRARTLNKMGRYYEALVAFDAAEDATDDPRIIAAIREERP